MTPTAAPTTSLIACHDCDLLHRRQRIEEGAAAKCSRCGAVLYRNPRDGIQRTLVFSLGALILYVLANVYPFMTFKLHGRVNESTVVTGVIELQAGGLWELALLVGFASVVAPLIKILTLLYISLPLNFGRTPWKLAFVYRAYQGIRPWGMLNVFVIGAFVAVSKLFDFGSLVLGIGFYAFIVLMVMTAAAEAAVDPQTIWERIKART